MEFRPRDYKAERESHALPRVRADEHPLATPSPCPSQPFHGHSDSKKQSSTTSNQETPENLDKKDFVDPLRSPEVDASEWRPAESIASGRRLVSSGDQVPSKEWSSFKRFLMQKFPVSKMISVSSMPDVIIRSGKANEKTSKVTRLEDLDDSERIFEEDANLITRQEYVSRLHDLKDEIIRAWNVEDRVTALKLSIKGGDWSEVLHSMFKRERKHVAKLLMDTSVLYFYPTLFVLATDVLDTLGDMVWKRVRQKAEFSENGSLLYSLPEDFKAGDICSNAKETCYNWLCKVGSIRELLPRIYLELAILPCWRFLCDNPLDSLQRLVMMMRGLADPLASTYCRLYMAHCARKIPASSTGYLVMCINDMQNLLMRLFSSKNTSLGHFSERKRLLISMMEPTIEYIMKCIFEDASQRQVDAVLVELGLVRNQAGLYQSSPCVSLVLHHLLKELPTEVVSSHTMYILDLVKCSGDSSCDQCMNFSLLGLRLSESIPQLDIVNSVVDEVIQVCTHYDRLDNYLKVVDAYMDIILQNQMDTYLNTILEGISKRVFDKEIFEDELGSLQSILMKLLSYVKDLKDVFALDHFLEILDVMYGTSRNVVNISILKIAARNGFLRDATTIQLLFEITQSLHDDLDFANMKDDDNQQATRLISRFIQMVDYGGAVEQHLTFLVECCGAFGSINEIKETLVHSSNCLAANALKDGDKHLSFVKSCLAFSEVTIPSISAQIRQLNLYLETAEVALIGGLVSHSDGLIGSAISSLESAHFTDGSRTSIDVDGILSSIHKLCSLLVMAPADPKQGITKVPKNILSLIYSQTWMTSKTKAKMFVAIILLSATLSQRNLPYRVCYSEILGNDFLFFGGPSYVSELVTLTERVIRNLVDSIEQEPSKAARGSMALEACNCIASSFKASNEVAQVCWKLIEIAGTCLSANDRYLQTTFRYLSERLPNSEVVTSTVT